MNLKAKQLTKEIGKSLLDQKNVWGNLIDSAVSAMSESTTAQADGNRSRTAGKSTLKFKLGGTSDRVDFSLQPGVTENEYLSAVLAHSTATYFHHADLQEFLLSLYFPNL